MDNIGKAHKDSFGVFIFDNAKDNLLSYLTAIMQRKIKMSLLIIYGPWQNYETTLIKNHLSDLQANAFFYLALPTKSSAEMTWHQIISLKSGSVINHLTFAESSSRIIEKFDLQGLQITSTSLTWAPYLTIDDCNEDGLECAKNYGYLIDIMDKLAVKFNFTFVSQKNVDNNWGLLDINGTFGGIVEEVNENNYDMSLSTWYWNIYRNGIFDFAFLFPVTDVMAMKPQPSKFDYTFFTRAFVGDAWVFVICTSCAASAYLLFAHLCGINDTLNGVKIMLLMLWLLYLLLNSYYGGVMTMFFSTTTPIPFETMGGAIRAYPEWCVKAIL